MISIFNPHFSFLQTIFVDRRVGTSIVCIQILSHSRNYARLAIDCIIFEGGDRLRLLGAIHGLLRLRRVFLDPLRRGITRLMHVELASVTALLHLLAFDTETRPYLTHHDR